MTSGITRDEQDSQVNQEVMRKPLRNEPGKEFFYGERGPQLLSMIITKATEEKAADFCKKNLFEPLGIKNFDWTYEFSGGVQYTQGGYGLQLTSRDLAKIGFLYLNNGIWADEQIVPESWISESVRGRVIVPDPKKGVSAYGLFWWIQPSVAYPSYMAVGWGGQFIYVVPSLDIVCVITTLDTGDNTFDYLTIVDDYVMPSARK
jgi:CubicO group peptidase (beta-lactamase class C family)